MALLLLIALVITAIFLFYYEFIWKKAERARGQPVLASSPWQDWKYRTLVELHRKNRLYPEEAAKLAGVSSQDMERYFDELESQGKIQSAGDAERGIFYKPLSSVTDSTFRPGSLPGPEGPSGSRTAGQARGFE